MYCRVHGVIRRLRKNVCLSSRTSRQFIAAQFQQFGGVSNCHREIFQSFAIERRVNFLELASPVSDIQLSFRRSAFANERSD